MQSQLLLEVKDRKEADGKKLNPRYQCEDVARFYECDIRRLNFDAATNFKPGEHLESYSKN